MWTILFSIFVHSFCGVNAQIHTYYHKFIPKNEELSINFGVSNAFKIRDEDNAYFKLDVLFQPLENYLRDPPSFFSETEMVLYHSSKKAYIGNEGWCCTDDLFDSGVCDEPASMILDFQYLHLKEQGDYYKSDASDIYYWKKNNTEINNKIFLLHPGMWYFVIADCDTHGALKMMDATLFFHNPSGYLSATQFPNVALYSSLTTAYCGLFLVWGYLMWIYRKNLVRIQYVMFLAIGTGFVNELIWLIQWNYYNENGYYIPWISVFGSILTAMKITIIRTLILLVSIGYSIIYPTLELNPKLSVIFLTVLYGTAEGTLQYLNALKNLGDTVPTPAHVGILIFITIINGIYFIWIGHSLYTNTKILRKKNLKPKRLIKMYTYLCYGLCIIGLVSLICFVIEHVLLALNQDEEALWSSWWLFGCYWEYLVFFVLTFVSFTWRPNTRNDKFDIHVEDMVMNKPTTEKEQRRPLPDAPLMYRFKKEPASPVSLKSPGSSIDRSMRELEISF